MQAAHPPPLIPLSFSFSPLPQIPSCLLFYLAVVFALLEFSVSGALAIAGFLYLFFATFMCAVRMKTRELYSINGDGRTGFKGEANVLVVVVHS